MTLRAFLIVPVLLSFFSALMPPALADMSVPGVPYKPHHWIRINVNSPDQYETNERRKLLKDWSPSRDMKQEAVVSFEIDSSLKVKNITLRQSSGSTFADKRVLRLVGAISPERDFPKSVAAIKMVTRFPEGAPPLTTAAEKPPAK